jgi:pimeloyl-ACP methyl ester carboxylesterase
VIAFDLAGRGPALILVDGALCHRAVGPNKRLAERLRQDFTVIAYDRRGRGESGDTAPYAMAREVEDIAALIEAAGGSAGIYGISSGGALALEAAKSLPDEITKVAVYEIPIVADDTRPPVPEHFPARLESLVADGKRGAAAKLFMREAVRLPAPLVAAMPFFPGWGKNKAVAHTLPYDATVMDGLQAGRPLTPGRWNGVTVPTLVASGGKSPAWVSHGAAQLADVLPNAEHRTLDGQRHYVKPDAIAPVLTDFFTASRSAPQPEPNRTA